MKRKSRRQPAPQLSPPAAPLTRREVLKGIVGLGTVTAISGCSLLEREPRRAPGPVFAEARPDLIRRENLRPGTRDWLLRNTRIDPATKYRCPWIEGYCSRASVRAGETIH